MPTPSAFMPDPSALRQEILRLTREYSRQVHAPFRPAADPDRQPWQEGSTIPYAGRVFTEDEVEAADPRFLVTLGKRERRFNGSWRFWGCAIACW